MKVLQPMAFLKSKETPFLKEKRDSNDKFEFAQGHSVLSIMLWISLTKIWHQWLNFIMHIWLSIYEQERLNTPESPNRISFERWCRSILLILEMIWRVVFSWHGC